ncbi:MAG: TIGR02281 family clan AA aspartic protease [Gammaproteobacteria bacterium]|nr:TIGR02281 family clan AA aspartic protease [Gammaproteobacteria bacterium]MDH3560781.1 TIGR02281 family clan AA aspartic protease [Gammaproteobacteria bacterium]
MRLSRFLVIGLVICQLGLAFPVIAGPDVRVVGLFKQRVVVLIDGKQRMLAVGQTSPEGVKLLSADSESAVLVVDGVEVRGTLDGRVSARKKSPSAQEVQIRRNNMSMYSTVGSINGLPVSFIVDTGATQIAMNDAQARRLGIDYRVDGEPTAITTASRMERAWAVMLDSVKVGDIALIDVSAVVLEGPQPEQVLLGMSFLSRLEMRNDGQLMTLRRKY